MAKAKTELQEKRKFPRRRFVRFIGLLFNGTYYMGLGEEIGEGGIALRLSDEFPVGREGVVHFQIPDGSFVSVRLEFLNARQEESGEYLIGCSFKNLKFEHKREIRTYVSARTETEH